MQISDWRVGGEPQRTLSDAWIRMLPVEPNTSIFLFPCSVRVLFFLGYWRPCLSMLSLFTTSSQLILIWRDLLQERICIQPHDGCQEDVLSTDLNHWSWTDFDPVCYTYVKSVWLDKVRTLGSSELLWTCHNVFGERKNMKLSDKLKHTGGGSITENVLYSTFWIQHKHDLISNKWGRRIA